MDPGTQHAGTGQNAAAALLVEPHQLCVERKKFTFDVRENPRGQFLRITEEVNGRFDTIIVPVAGLEQFRDTLDQVIKRARGPRR